jgi:predicted transposase YdaD
VQPPFGGRVHTLEYQVLRSWTLDLEEELRGSLATLPLASLPDAAAGVLSEVLRRMEERLVAEAAPEERKDLWTDIFVLMGLRYPRQNVAQLLRGIPAMRESDTYQAIVEEGMELGMERGLERGRLEGALHALLLVGTPRLGEPDAATRRRLESVTELARLDRWLQEISRVESWSDLPGL